MKNHETPFIVPALERTIHAVALWIDRSFRALSLTQAEAHVLEYLTHHAPCSINDLHRSFGHKRSTLTSILDRLEGRGWIRREAHPTSRRLVLVQLTEAGQQIGERVSAALHALEECVLQSVGDEDIAVFLQVLHTLEEELAHESHV